MYPICKPRSVPRQPGITRRVESPTPLHYAAAEGDVAAIRKLLAEGAEPNATAYFGMTPLHVVVRQYSWRCRNFFSADRWAECAKLLLEGGANPMLRCMPNTTPAGLGEGHVPPALRDAMTAMAAEGVWLEDERSYTQEDRLKDLYGGAQRPGERAVAGVGVSNRRLAEMTAVAARMEREELDNRGRMSQEHVRIGWWTKRKPNRHARAPKRSTGSRSEVAMA